MALLDKFRIKRNPEIIEYIKNPNSKLIEYAISCGYKIDWKIDIEKFKEFCSYDCFLERFKKDQTFLEKIKEINVTIDLKKIFRIVFDNNPTSFLTFYKNSILNNFDYFASFINIEAIYMYIIENFTIEEIPQELFNNNKIISVEENIIKKNNVKSIITFLENAKVISKNIISLIEIKILENPMEYYNDLNMIIKIIHNKKRDFSEEFYTKYKKSNQEYLEQVLIQDPKSSSVELPNLSSSTREKIISKIREEHIIFETIPYIYLKYEDIYSEIIKNNNKVSNIIEITKYNWSNEKLHRLLEYTSYKFHKQTPKLFYEDINYFMGELKKDFSIIKYAPRDMDLSIKEVAEIFELYTNQKDIKINDSELLKTNPLVVLNELKAGNINIKEIDLSNIKYKKIINHELQKYELDNSKDSNTTDNSKDSNTTDNSKDSNTTDNSKDSDLTDNSKDSNSTDNIFKNIDSYIYISVNDIETVKKYVELKENNLLNNTIIFKYENYDYNAFIITDNISYFKTIKNKKDIYFDFVGDKLLDLEQIIKDDEFLDYCVQDIKSSDLSPFEKYIAVYDIVKNIKEYNKNYDIDAGESRNIYLILNNNYIVCAGYAHLLETLLKRIGIKSTYLVSPTAKKENLHAIAAVEIKDDKYNLDGVYLSDPTYDNPEVSSIKKVNQYKGVLFRLKNTALKTDYKNAEMVDARLRNRENAIDNDSLFSAVMTVKKRIFKNLSHSEELELTLATGLKSGEKRKQLEKELYDLKVGLYKSCLDKKISELKTIEYSDYIAEIFKDEINKHIIKYNDDDVELWNEHLYDDFKIGFMDKEKYTEEQSDYLNDNNYKYESKYYTKRIIISPDSTINDVLNELDSTLSELKKLGLIDTEVNENKKSL